jgi:Terminase large subunit, T4likevirus-type, N-terminal
MPQKPSEKKLNVQLYTPHSGQLLLHNCTARFRVMSCGRRFGKTLAATNEIAKKSLENKYTLNWWIAPTYRQTEIAFNLLVEALRPVCTKEPNRSKMRIELINGSVIECRSAERYENLRGDDPSFVVIDEAAKCPRALWDEAVSPALADHQGGAIFISTPFGHDWFWELFQLGQDPAYPDWWSKSFPTAANPFIAQAEIDQQKLRLPEYSFAQEFEAVFLDDNASAFRKVDQCIAGELMEPEYGHYYALGWDVAKYDDYSVVTVIDVNTGHLVYFDRFHRISYGDQIDQKVAPVAKLYHGASVLMDATGVGDAVLEEARKRDIVVEGYVLSTKTKKELVDEAVVAIEQMYVTYPNIPVLIDELKSYGYKLTESGNIVFSAPEGKHDDCVISFCLAVHAAKRGGRIASAVTARKPRIEILSATQDPRTDPPKVEVDDAFIMERQLRMARTLSLLRSSAPYQAAAPIDPNSEWGIA